ncbi:chemotaxis response regulator protein-glutamate methylesterase [Spirochaetia bacterium 38H-sp]|uniref:Protein-glutamate methylesterase/protein-glutamine glutaminase n=1 Tax=Rarispira pelagica TaxID=3141764 RepID=A0ABU9U8X9_9SPIR
MAEGRIKVLIVDDSALMRSLISKILDETNDIIVVGTAMHGGFAMDKIPKLKPDVIVLDLEMPKVDGLEFLRRRKEAGIDIPVVILSSRAEKGAKITMDALALGASDFITKPSGPISPDIHVVAETLQEMVRGYGRKYRRQRGDAAFNKMTAPPRRMAETAPPVSRVVSGQELGFISISPKIKQKKESITPLRKPDIPEVLAIGVSTGGPSAVRFLLSKLDEDFSLPVLLVQHMPPGFTKEFAESLDRHCAVTVTEAVNGDKLEPGHVYVAPGDYHLFAEQRGSEVFVGLSKDPPVNGHRPSADVLFESVARIYQNRSISVIMTGMGRDGARMIGEVYRQGGITIGQDEESCVVYGMPRAASELGVLHMELPLEDIPVVINKLASKAKK